jgi:hypothetical protein
MEKIKNVGSEPLAFTGFPMLQPGDELEVTKEQAELLVLNDSIEIVGKKKNASFKGVEEEK